MPMKKSLNMSLFLSLVEESLCFNLKIINDFNAFLFKI